MFESLLKTETNQVCSQVCAQVMLQDAEDVAEIITEEQADKLAAETGIETLLQEFAEQILEEDPECFSHEEREEALADMACMRVIKLLAAAESGAEM